MMQSKKHQDNNVIDTIADICRLRLTLRTLSEREARVQGKKSSTLYVRLTNSFD